MSKQPNTGSGHKIPTAVGGDVAFDTDANYINDVKELLYKDDGSIAYHVAMLAEITREQLTAVGGTCEDTPEREMLVYDDPALAEQIREGIAEAEAGKTTYLGSFSRFVGHDENSETFPKETASGGDIAFVSEKAKVEFLNAVDNGEMDEVAPVQMIPVTAAGFASAINDPLTEDEIKALNQALVSGVYPVYRKRPPIVRQWHVWSNKHQLWWGPNRKGYFHYLSEAGRYSTRDAVEIMNDHLKGSTLGQNGFVPDVIIIPAPSPYDEETRAARATKAKEVLYEMNGYNPTPEEEQELDAELDRRLGQ